MQGVNKQKSKRLKLYEKIKNSSNGKDEEGSRVAYLSQTTSTVFTKASYYLV